MNGSNYTHPELINLSGSSKNINLKTLWLPEDVKNFSKTYFKFLVLVDFLNLAFVNFLSKIS